MGRCNKQLTIDNKQGGGHKSRMTLSTFVNVCLLLIAYCLLTTSCSVSKSSFSPSKKYSPDRLQKDYSIYRDILEEAHPGLYWYTSKDSMDHYFNWGRQQLN